MTDLATTLLAGSTAVIGVGTLYTLHHLRIRPQRQATATLLFWQQAVRPQQTKVLWNTRLSHRKTFAMMSAIVLLLTAALVADRWNHDSDEKNVIVIDTGAATGTKDASGNTLLAKFAAESQADLNRMGRAAVISTGPRPMLVSEADAPPALAAQRINALEPQSGASASSLGLLMAGGVIGDHSGNIHWYTDRSQLPDGLPEEFAKRVIIHAATFPEAVAITGVAFEPSEKDRSHGTLHVAVAGNTMPAEMTLDAAFDGRPNITRAVNLVNGSADVAFDDQLADGCLVRLQLNGAPGASAIHTAEYHLANHGPLTFRFGSDVPTALKLALKTVGSEGSHGAVYVGHSASSVPVNVKAAILVADGGNGVISGEPLELNDASVLKGLTLEGATAGEGAAISITGMPLLSAGRATVASFQSAGVPTLLLSSAIVGSAADLPRRAVFPVLLGRLCNMLLGHGRSPTAAVPDMRSAEDPLWNGPADAPRVTVSTVADRPAIDTAALGPAVVDAGRGGWRWVQIVLAVALALLALDASLRAAGKIV